MHAAAFAEKSRMEGLKLLAEIQEALGNSVVELPTNPLFPFHLLWSELPAVVCLRRQGRRSTAASWH